ncbi:MAG: amylosucrase [Spirochaetes bacterium GWD1_61_31]|nr:MAG: amylosucrase [Spirochaetes bacterium GWB1_60_80]OHD33314.1 MAG: amylosucrase [Spirochaetes bacterium GWC1_61_12]OHD34546.1 MAG: amylosucrase [Spirochaetes bacterium GWD1_61_31]OHD41565.1 MAG: amylosucrase [Spirochaetes bacterium GWE1_60_18]OHD61470.1 MAG: amylosucrase [Spirochaetes bacterium GWF1_60_12]HAP43384.1 amylosucrase [Spirochaetaceae bacterium]
MKRTLACFLEQCQERWTARRMPDSTFWPDFSTRLEVELPRLIELLWSLYGERPDFAFQFEELIAETFTAFCSRPARLREYDRKHPPESGLQLDGRQVGAVAYAGRFAKGFKGLADRIPYLKELGISYLHLMPFFLAPEKENDGGYAVSSYRETDPALGSMTDLENLSAQLAQAGMALVVDFIFNHTSNEHEWALKAKDGQPRFQDFYYLFADQAETVAYQAHLRDIFPEHRKGSFTWDAGMARWVWTSFNSFQWDLNYRNPEVFRAMAAEMTGLANRGVSVLRLDAVAFIWKQAGTSCENLPQAHTIIRAFQSLARLACPGLLFKSEAIVHPDDIAKYIDLRECQLSYNPLLMAELWEAAATKDVRLLAASLAKRHHLPSGCAWVNYVRCHDDIGWTFADEDAAELGIKGADHRSFLNEFYLGRFPGSFSRGVSFQYNPLNGDRRICGTAASLAGLERALEEGSATMLETALRRLQLLYGIVYSVGGLPLLYLGDEVAALNDYGYLQDPAHAADSRWVHRPRWSESLYKQRLDANSVAGRMFQCLRRYAQLRRSYKLFAVQSLAVLDGGNKAILAYHKQAEGQLLTVLGNFSEEPVIIPAVRLADFLGGAQGANLLDGRIVLPHEDLALEPCELLWILVDFTASE